MATTSLVPVVVSAKLNKNFEEQSIARNITNTEWEGEISNKGASVKIQSLTASTVKTYSGTITYEDAASTETSLTIATDEYFATKVTVKEQKQAQEGIDIMGEIVKRTMPNLLLNADKTILSLYSDITTNTSGTTGTPIAINSANILDEVIKFNKVMDRQNVMPEDRWMVMPPEIFSKVTLAGIALDTDNSDILTNRWMGKLLGVNIFVSNQVQEDGAGVYKIIGGSYSGIAFAQQIMSVDYLERLEGSFAGAVRGRSLYGANVINETKLYLLTATEAAEA